MKFLHYLGDLARSIFGSNHATVFPARDDAAYEARQREARGRVVYA